VQRGGGLRHAGPVAWKSAGTTAPRAIARARRA
jgi:hypothetical protein